MYLAETAKQLNVGEDILNILRKDIIDPLLNKIPDVQTTAPQNITVSLPPSKTDYTPWIAAGVIVASLGTAMYLFFRKRI